jgi:signal transduction histidine kinase
VTDLARFAQLTSLACHDLRTPLATVYGFARSLRRLELDETQERYVEMIEAASEQLGDLLEELALVARIEAGRFDPVRAEVDSLVLARGAAEALGEERVEVAGEGAPVSVPQESTQRALTQLVRAALRHGGLDRVRVDVRGAELTVSPLTRTARPVVLGEELRELGPAAAAALVSALGGSLAAPDESLVVRLPE